MTQALPTLYLEEKSKDSNNSTHLACLEYSLFGALMCFRDS